MFVTSIVVKTGILVLSSLFPASSFLQLQEKTNNNPVTTRYPIQLIVFLILFSIMILT